MTKSLDMSICEKFIEEKFNKLEELGFDKNGIHNRVCELIDRLLFSLSKVKVEHAMQERIVTIIRENSEYFAKHMREGYYKKSE